MRWLLSISVAALCVGIGTTVQASGTAEPDPVTVSTAYSGPGFDPCWAPSNVEMDAWLQSPYRAIGVYLGGPRYAAGCRAANSANLTSAWVHRQAAKGWRFLPIYVGSQAWYASGTAAAPERKDKPKGKAKAKPGARNVADHKPNAEAAADGPHLSDFDDLSADAAGARAMTEADDAVRIASGLGFPVGSVIYNDMEGYPGTYRDQVLAYSRGWTAELHRLGYRSGWYSSSDSGIEDQSRAYGVDSPDVVDIADWNGAATVEDSSVQADQWSNHQRVHQSAGDHDETWGGVTLSVDSDWVDVGTADRGAVERLAGRDRDATAAAVSQRAFDCAGCSTPGRDRARSAVLSRNDGYADALGGAALAAQSGGPLMLTASGKLSEATGAELHRILAPGSTVFLLGGPTALSSDVEKAVRAEGFLPVRIAGHDRYQTAVEIARTISGNQAPASLLVVTGADFHDALAASAAAGAIGTAATAAEQADAEPGTSSSRPHRHGAAVVLTDGATMPCATSAYLATVNPRATKVYAIGTVAASALSGADFTLIAEQTHSGTAAAVARQFFSQPTTAVLTYGHDWPDALAGSAVAAHWSAPLLFTDRDALPPATESYLSAKTKPITTEIIIGGENDITAKTAISIGNAAAPAGRWDIRLP
ncbi:MAG: DUF1906 domain-containing protein [Catenulispora sp.]|nr:DUF1906 domain-containing protein [Catenulispora sp.]